MRRFASRFLLVALVGVVIASVIVRADARGGDLASLDGIRAEGQPQREAFRVDQPMRVAVDATGSFESGGADSVLAAHGWLVHRETGRVVWRMRPRQRPERGAFVAMRDTVVLGPGTYEAVYAALGDPLARAPRASGGTFGERARDFFRGGGRGWIGDADRWHLYVSPATPEDRDRATRLDVSEVGERPGTLWSSAPLRSGGVRTGLLRVTAPAAVRVDALFEATPQATLDSAYVLAASGDTLWTARYGASAWAGGAAKNREAADTLRLTPGTYRVVSRADRDHAVGSWTANPPWRPWDWGLRVSAADSAAASGAVTVLDPVEDAPRLVQIACAGGDESTEVPFKVTEPLDVIAVAVGERSGGEWYDYAQVLRADGSALWDLREAPTRHARGRSGNRRAEAELRLAPGRYALRYTTDPSHHCGDFRSGDAPAPDDFWGVALVAADGEAAGGRLRVLAPEDRPEPLAALPPEAVLASLTRTGNNRDVTAQFTLERPASVCILGVGELSETERYDWGRITRRGGETVWEMKHALSYPLRPGATGTDATDRAALVRLALRPGRYTVRYQTDGSRAWDDWLAPAPPAAELWGVQVWRAPEAPPTDPPLAACLLPGVPRPPALEMLLREGAPPEAPAPGRAAPDTTGPLAPEAPAGPPEAPAAPNAPPPISPIDA